MNDLIPFAAFEPTRVKLAHPVLAKWSAQLKASTFNGLGQYASSRLPESAVMQNSLFFSPAVVVTVARTHFGYPRMDGQAELAWMAD